MLELVPPVFCRFASRPSLWALVSSSSLECLVAVPVLDPEVGLTSSSSVKSIAPAPTAGAASFFASAAFALSSSAVVSAAFLAAAASSSAAFLSLWASSSASRLAFSAASTSARLASSSAWRLSRFLARESSMRSASWASLWSMRERCDKSGQHTIVCSLSTFVPRRERKLPHSPPIRSALLRPSATSGQQKLDLTTPAADRAAEA